MNQWVRPRQAGTRHNKRIPSGIAEPVTSSVSGLLGEQAHVRKATSRCLRCCPEGAVVALGRPPQRARGGHDLSDPKIGAAYPARAPEPAAASQVR